MCSNVKIFVSSGKVNAWPNETSLDMSFGHFSGEVTESIKRNWFKAQVWKWLIPSSELSGEELGAPGSSALPFIPFTMLAGQEGLASNLAQWLPFLPELFSVLKAWGAQKKAEISQTDMEPVGRRARVTLVASCPITGLACLEGACVISCTPAAARALGLHVSCQQFSQFRRHCPPCGHKCNTKLLRIATMLVCPDAPAATSTSVDTPRQMLIIAMVSLGFHWKAFVTMMS